MESWADEDFEMTAAEVKGRDAKCTWEIIGICRALNEMGNHRHLQSSE
jgi:hypothetical protein